MRRSLPDGPSPDKSHERQVGVPSLWPRLGGVFQEPGLGVIRQLGLTQTDARDHKSYRDSE